VINNFRPFATARRRIKVASRDGEQKHDPLRPSDRPSKRLPKGILAVLRRAFRTAAWGRDLRMTTGKAGSVASVT